MLWLYLDFYQLTLDALEQTSDEKSARPCVIYQAEVNQIVQRNALAKERGIEVGMGMAQAAALSADLNVIDYKQERESGHLQMLACALYQLIGDIVVYPPSCLAIRLDPSIKFYDGLMPLWQALVTQLRQQKVTYHFATGWSIESAKVLAKAKTNAVFSDRSNIQKALQYCHLKHTDLSAKQISSLARVGIHTLRGLLALPATELGKRFDNALITYLTALRGEVYPHCVYFHPAEKFSQTIEPTYEISHTHHLMPWVRRLLDQLAIFLRLRNQITHSLTLTLYFREQEQEDFEVGSACPLSDAATWHPLFELLIEKLTLSEPVTAIGLSANTTEEMTGENSDFFSDRFHYFAKMQLIGRLQAKLGEDNLNKPDLTDDHRLDVIHPPHSARPLALPDRWQPLFIATNPIPLSKPSHIQFGPVRMQTGWWDGHYIKRDYFITQSLNGELLLIYKCSPEAQWYIQGWYS
ncbi:Y-family DNA polymerase [Alteromonas sp. ASW11-130]|uniref:Y-family DNA polymerase n=1 Tax=Alteromonas sp. ASW11-130 TaxID=3015775 RepID=UPI00224205F4|nr:DNA polymerase Y family protein [Alteromonas sp. ASW11-130]MCW8091196.1 DNA polymerase Y family protein [Alteromonas sp. ASW11-130]